MNIQRAFHAWLFSEGRLPDSFPWTLQIAGKKYLAAIMHFLIGSFLLPLLFVAALFGLSKLQSWHGILETPGGSFRLALYAWPSAALLLLFGNCLRFCLKGNEFALGALFKATPLYLLLGAGLAALFPWALQAVYPVYPLLLQFSVSLVMEADGRPRMSFVMMLSFVSFVTGFGTQLRYIAGELRKTGLPLAKTMGLTFEPLRGASPRASIYKLIGPVLLAYASAELLTLLVVFLLGPAHQPTAELAREATGGNFLLFALMAVVGAPIFEELVFRGFLYQMLRASLKREPRLLSAEKPDLAESASSLSAVGQIWRSISERIAVLIYRLMGGKRADLGALLISSLTFSLMHMQFQPTAVLLLFLLGALQAELFRRTGSLYCCMLLHALNNGIEVLSIAMGQA